MHLRTASHSLASVAIAVAVGAALVGLTGCGNDDATSASTAPSTAGASSTTDAVSSTAAPTNPTAPATTEEPAAAEPTTTAAPSVPVELDALQRVLDDAQPGLPTAEATVQAAVWSPSRDLDWAAASGPDTDAAGRPFRMASVGKTITAVTVLELAALGELELDAPIGPLLTAETVELLAGDGYELDSITVAQLLNHTSGVFDYAFGEGTPLLNIALADRDRRWTRREQIELAVSVGEPLWPAGGGFAYSDTGYVLLGEIIETVTGVSYHEAAREVLDFDGNGLDHLWLEAFEPAPVDLLPISRSFLVAEELSDLDFSLDAFGGGGYAGTPRDVVRFFGLLFAGEVIDAASLDVLRAVPDTNIGREEFGVLLGDGAHGVYRMDVGGVECWSHRGFLGTIAMACPEADVSLVVTTNVAQTEPLSIAASLLGVVTG